MFGDGQQTLAAIEHQPVGIGATAHQQAPAPQLAWRQRFSADPEVDPSVVLSESIVWAAPYNLMLHRAFRVVNQ